MSCTPLASVTINNQTIQVQIADSLEEQRQGLMQVKTLTENQGMLFIFDSSQPRSFWMKNTLIPLDAFFFDKNLTLIDKISMEPCLEDPCQKYPSLEQSMYVLEVNQGIYKFNTGDVMSLS